MGVCSSESSDMCTFFRALLSRLQLDGRVRLIRLRHPEHGRVLLWVDEHKWGGQGMSVSRVEWDGFVGVFVKKIVPVQ